MKKVSGFHVVVTFLFFFSLIAGCSSPYAPAPQILPAHIQKIAIRPFVNNTTQYGLEEKLMLKVVDEFVRDGRLVITNNEEEADGVLVGEINRYILQPLTYDQNLVTKQYKLWILLNVYFIDKKDNVTLWSEPNLEGIEIFYDATEPGGQTEEEVREMIWENLSRDIVKRTFEGFGSVSGASEKKIPK
ncbi:MAG: hypothetical protein JW871_01960 [Endomicrobiales bacterium]|nr:hypothetical protein [Endomicrobiales bacterium]